MARTTLVLFAAALLGGCATSKPVTFTCPGLDRLHARLEPTRLQAAIQSDAAAPFAVGAASAGPGLQDLLDEAYRRPAAPEPPVIGPQSLPGEAAPQTPPPGPLLLSGGGQWGALGAGYLAELHRRGLMPRATFISGVSTGALQALFLAGANDPATAPLIFEKLVAAYTLRSEKDIVDRGPQFLAALTGSVAGTKPLRRRIETQLCPEPDCTRSPILSILRNPATPPVVVGYVRADNGDFYFADLRRLAALQDPKQAQQCLTAVAMASAAVPVFYRQVRINDITYYDGGVRQSVFEAEVASAAASAARLAGGAKQPLYVIRNGPTTSSADENINEDADALSAALRVEGIMVNQLEVGSLAALRITNPENWVGLVTADGWDAKVNGVKRCDKSKLGGRPAKGVMFNREFMACLQGFGREKAARAEPWIRLPTLCEVNNNCPAAPRSTPSL